MADPLPELPPYDRELLLLRHPSRIKDTGPPLSSCKATHFIFSVLAGGVHGVPLRL
jgi:hypothetical protein